MQLLRTQFNVACSHQNPLFASLKSLDFSYKGAISNVSFIFVPQFALANASTHTLWLLLNINPFPKVHLRYLRNLWTAFSGTHKREHELTYSEPKDPLSEGDLPSSIFPTEHASMKASIQHFCSPRAIIPFQKFISDIWESYKVHLSGHYKKSAWINLQHSL